MENNLIGEKKVFAIEYAIRNEPGIHFFGSCKIWLSDFFLGDFENDVFLIAVIRSLNGVLNTSNFTSTIPLLPSTSKELLTLMEGDEIPDIANNYFLAIEGFDHFLKLFFRKADEIVFYWSLHPDIESNSEYENYPKMVRSFTLPITIFENVVNKFKETLDAAGIKVKPS
jgi:hypothetical protein